MVHTDEHPLQVLIPEQPGAGALRPWLERIDAERQYSNFGPLCRELQDALARVFVEVDYLPHVAMCNNGTLALELALRATGLARGCRVLIPALTFPASGLAALHAGLEPVFADVDADSLQLTPELAANHARRTHIDAVMPVAAFGTPCPAQAWDDFARESSLPVIIDAAGAFGNQRALRHGTVVFSLHATKALAAGEGGFVVTGDECVASRVRRLGNFGFEDGQCMELGTNAKLSEYHAAVALAGLSVWPEKKRRLLALRALYRETLATVSPGVTLPHGDKPVAATVLPALLPEGLDTCAIAAHLGQAGIQTRRWYWPALHRHPVFAAHIPHDPLPVTEEIGRRLLGLPFHLALEPGDIARVADALNAAMYVR